MPFDPLHLTPKQEAYVRDHALELWCAVMCPPNDRVEDILAATCPCCEQRREFVRRVLAT